MTLKVDDREYLSRLIQDMRVRARDIDDFDEEMKYKGVIKKFEKGIKDELKNTYY
jgi:hypothetical protein